MSVCNDLLLTISGMRLLSSLFNVVSTGTSWRRKLISCGLGLHKTSVKLCDGRTKVGDFSQKIDTLLDKITTLVKGQLTNIKSEMLGVQQATMAEIKKIKYTDAPKFKKTSHEEQWKLNRKILDNLEEASEALADVKTDPGSVEHLEKAKKEKAEGKSSLNERQN